MSETPEDNEFRYESLLRMSNCLFHTDEIKRRDYYYEQAQSIASTLENLDNKDPPEVDKKHNDISAEGPMTLEKRIKRARISKEALQNSTMRIHDKVREAKAAVVPSVMLTRPVPKSIPEVKARPSQGIHRIMTGDTTFSSSTAFSRGPESSGGLGSTGMDDQRKHDLYKPAIQFAAKSIAAGNYKRAKELLSNIPESERSVKVYLLFIQLARKQPPAETPLLSEKACWECIIELQPMALEAYIHLLRLQMALPILLNTIPADCVDKPWMKSYLQGMDHFFHMRYKAALAEFRALDMKYPQNVDIKLKVALCYRWLVKRTDSCRMFAQIRRIDPYFIDDMYHYAAVLVDLEKEQKVSEEALRMDPACLEAADGLCVILGSQFRNEEALDLLDKQIDYNRVDEAHVKKAGIYMGMEQWRMALLNYQQALFANPKNPQAKAGREQVERTMCGLDDDDADYGDDQDFERHGCHVRNVVGHSYQSGKTESNLVQRRCPFAETMSANIGMSGLEFTYSCLESFFKSMTHLRVLSLKTYLNNVIIAMLWSLSNARQLAELNLTFTNLFSECPFIYSTDDFMAVVDCCSHIPTLMLRDSFMYNIDKRRSLMDEKWKTRLVKAVEIAPASPQTANDRAFGSKLSFFGRLTATGL
ncbi:Anaphase-promoting complex subunit 7 [Podila clonocystis]|nr:Anaphase-promoting complex subunit 7 [Podila clonocystis]